MCDALVAKSNFRGMDAEKYRRRNRQMRKVLGTLDQKATRMIFYENAKILIGKNTP